MGGLSHSRRIQTHLPLRTSPIGHLGGPFVEQTNPNAFFLFERPHCACPYWASWGPVAEHTNPNAFSSLSVPIGHLGGLSQSRRIQTPVPLRASLLGILRAFRRADEFQRLVLVERTDWASWGGPSHSRRIQTPIPLRPSLLGVLKAFRRADEPFLFERPITSLFGILGGPAQSRRIQTPFLFEGFYWASWGPFAEQTNPNADSSSNVPIGHLFFFERSYWASWGPFAEQTNPNAFSFSKVPFRHLGALSQNRRIQAPFLFERPYCACPYWASWGPVAEHTNPNAFSSASVPIGHLGGLSQSRRIQTPVPLRASLRRADEFQRRVLVERTDWASWGGPSHSRRIQTPIPLRPSLLGVLKAFRRADEPFLFERPITSLFGILGGPAQSRRIQTPFLFEGFYWASWGPFAEQTNPNADSSSNVPIGHLFFFERSYWASWGPFAEQTNPNAFSFSKVPFRHLGALSQNRRIQAPFLFERPYCACPYWASWGAFRTAEFIPHTKASSAPSYLVHVPDFAMCCAWESLAPRCLFEEPWSWLL